MPTCVVVTEAVELMISVPVTPTGKQLTVLPELAHLTSPLEPLTATTHTLSALTEVSATERMDSVSVTMDSLEVLARESTAPMTATTTDPASSWEMLSLDTMTGMPRRSVSANVTPDTLAQTVPPELVSLDWTP